MNKYQHENHISYQRCIKLFKDSIKYRNEWLLYGKEKAEYVAINDCLIIDYKEFWDILKNAKFCWMNLGRHISLNMDKIDSIRIF